MLSLSSYSLSDRYILCIPSLKPLAHDTEVNVRLNIPGGCSVQTREYSELNKTTYLLHLVPEKKLVLNSFAKSLQ